MKNRDLFTKDPLSFALLNDGVARVADQLNADEILKLRFELETFVCEGQYARGLERILRSYLDSMKKPDQPAVWVSGFFGSGKSHLVKVLQYLWLDYKFDDGATARGVAQLPADVRDLLKALGTEGKRAGGLIAAAGTLGSGAGESVRLALLGVVFRAAGLPEEYAKARFVIWLKNEGIYEDVRARIAKAGKDFNKELSFLYVSETLAQSIIAAKPGFAKSTAEAKSLLKTQFPVKDEITDGEMHNGIMDAIGSNDKIPCTLIVLDEVQQFIGDSSERTYAVQEVTESCSKHFGGRLLFVATGQNALAGTPQLQKLMARFQVHVELADSDVETVTRRMVLAKKPDKMPALKALLDSCSGEISRHLVSTKLSPRQEDEAILAPDYPVLPVRRRFWEWVLRQVDRAGTTAQLRTQLKIIFEAIRATANGDLGTVVGGDFLFDQIATTMVQTGVLLREINELIKKQDDGTPAGKLRYRLCALIFMIGKLPRESNADLGIRATPEMLADLLVTDLKAGSAELRKQIPELLQGLETAGSLMKVGDEYRLQTREGSAWDSAFRDRQAKIANDESRLASERADLLRNHCNDLLKDVRVIHGKSKVARKIEASFTPEMPPVSGSTIPLWFRDGWGTDEKSVLADARQAGSESPVVTVFVPRRAHESLKKALCALKAADETLNARGNPTTPEGIEARTAMETRRIQANTDLTDVISEVLSGTRVFMGGGTEMTGISPTAAIQDAAEAALARLYPQFGAADDANWEKVIERTKNGDGGALDALGYKGDVANHPVCKAILEYVIPGKIGKDVRRNFAGQPYGWAQDAVDGALLVLFVNGLVRATQDETPLDRKQLDQTKIGVAKFRAEVTTISASQKISIRKLITAAPIDCKAGEEVFAAAAYLTELLRRAEAASGDAPLPQRPDTKHIQQIKANSGNDLLAALYQQRERLEKEAAEWSKTEQAIAKRTPRWRMLQALLKHASGVDAAKDVQAQVDAIIKNRSLLADPDPIPPLCTRLAGELRKALLAARQRFEEGYAGQMQQLQTTTRWPEVAEELQAQFLAQDGLKPSPELRVGTEEELLTALEDKSLSEWRTATDALPTRFQKVAMKVARMFEPQAVQVKLPNATLKTEADVDKWLAGVKDQIMTRLKDKDVGAVIV